MKVIQVIGICLITLIVGIVLLLSVWAHGYKLNPVLVEISDKSPGWQMLVPLENERLINADIKSAENWLYGKGFRTLKKPYIREIVLENQNQEIGTTPKSTKLIDVYGDSIFIRQSSQLRYFCNVSYVVVLNTEGKIVKRARGMVYETGCL